MFNKNEIWRKIESNLFPEVHPFGLILKIFILHSLTCLTVLLFCPQFGFGILKVLGMNSLFDMTTYFMKVSHEFCQIACGATLFISSTSVIFYQLKTTEKEWLIQQKLIVFSLLILLTGGLFIFIAPDITLLNIVLWVIGSSLSIIFKTNNLFTLSEN